MRNLKYFIPIYGILIKNNPYKNKFKKPGTKEMAYDFYQMIVSMGFLLSLILMTF
jgi:hypothetical protein